MKKLFFGLTFLIILIIGGVYALLFTSTGNSIVASKIEDTANEQKGVNFVVNKFVLTTSKLEFDATVNNNSNINISGDLALLAKTVDLNYDINIKDLSKLQQFTGQKLNGSFNTKGTLKGNQELAVLKGFTSIFASDTNYDIKLVDFKPQDISLDMKKARIDKILFLVNQPVYARGLVDIDAKIDNANISTLSGTVKTDIKNGLVQNAIVNKAFNLKLNSPLRFNGEVNTNLEPYKAVSKVDFYTTMANLFAKTAQVDLKDNIVTSDYKVSVKDLSKLYDLTQTKMRGSVEVNGNIKKDKDLLVNGTSNLLDGKLDFKLLNNDFTASLNEIEVLKVLHMLYYPEVFTSKTKLDLDYNLANQVGELKGNLINGQFKKNQYSTIINNFARFDITKEVYEKVDLNSKINKNIIKSTVKMKSNLTTIKVDPSTIDTQKSTIDALVMTDIKGIKFDTKLTGNISSPKVKVDTSKLLKSGVKQKAKEEIEKQIQDKIGDKAGELLKGFFN